MNNKKEFLRAVFCACAILLSSPLFAYQKDVEATISLANLFGVYADMESGIKGTVNSGGKIEVVVRDKTTNTIVFQVSITSTSTSFSGIGINYKKADLGTGAIYYPNVWNSKDIKTALGSIDRKRYDSSTIRPYPIFKNNIDLKIKITETNATMNICKIPGIGLIDRNGGNALFDSRHYCHDLKSAASLPTIVWSRMKQPDISKPIDLSIAARRGIWGDNLGAGSPENSIEAIKRTKQFTDILESDIMITKDKQLIVSHDYNMDRLSDYSGSERDYLFNLNGNVLDNLHLRRRNMQVSNFKYLKFGDLVDALVANDLVLTIDIKDIIARIKNGVCIDNCEYDPKTHGEEARRKTKESWMDIFKGCIRIAASKHALQYIAFKVPHTYDDQKNYMSEDTLSQVLFMPVIQPGRQDYLDFTDSWISHGNERVIAYETNFKPSTDQALKPITREGKAYQNFLHYVYARTGLRPGCYPEEPMGPKGIVSRWADWKIKDLTQDIRGDHYLLMTIPYGKIMVLTTDRPDIWQKVAEIYNNIPK